MAVADPVKNIAAVPNDVKSLPEVAVPLTEKLTVNAAAVEPVRLKVNVPVP